jgi:predicted ester cyclase
MRYVERGRLKGDAFLGIEPTGQQYAKPATTVHRVEAGRLARSWGVEDTLGWFRQLGKYE